MNTTLREFPKAASFLQSALRTENQFQSIAAFLDWFRSRGEANDFAVHPISFAEMDAWYFDAKPPQRLRHRSGRFFSIDGIRVETNYGPVPTWDQPIINQPEIGILGIITQVFDGVRYFLMQAKMEPGNINTLQLSPTVQATKSNYTQVHQGNLPHYLEYFIDRTKARILVDQLQSEQGSRFLQKRNRNMIVEVTEKIPVRDDFCWLTLGQLKQLLRLENLVNMDARTVLSCIPYIETDPAQEMLTAVQTDVDAISVFDHRLTGFPKDLFLSVQNRAAAVNSLDEIISWFSHLKTKYELSITQVPLNETRHWHNDGLEIRHETGHYFSVMAVSVQAGNREVVSWTQPLLKHTDYGVVGFLTQKINGTLHFLVRASLEPGNRDLIEMGPTVACSNATQRSKLPHPPRFLDLFLDPDPRQVRYAAIQSEEGGRFYHFQNRYMLLELDEQAHLDFPENFIWLTLGQIIDFIKYSYFNIEARNLIACLDLLHEADYPYETSFDRLFQNRAEADFASVGQPAY